MALAEQDRTEITDLIDLRGHLTAGRSAAAR
jgi:hypothetical protein